MLNVFLFLIQSFSVSGTNKSPMIMYPPTILYQCLFNTLEKYNPIPPNRIKLNKKSKQKSNKIKKSKPNSNKSSKPSKLKNYKLPENKKKKNYKNRKKPKTQKKEKNDSFLYTFVLTKTSHVLVKEFKNI